MQNISFDIQEVSIRKNNLNTFSAQYSIPIGDNDDIHYSRIELRNDNSSLCQSQNLSNQLRQSHNKVQEEKENSKIDALYDFNRDDDTCDFSYKDKCLQKVVGLEQGNQMNSQFKINKDNQYRQSSEMINAMQDQTYKKTQDIQKSANQIQLASLLNTNQKNESSLMRDNYEQEQDVDGDGDQQDSGSDKESNEQDVVVNPIAFQKKKIQEQDSEDTSQMQWSSQKAKQNVLYKTRTSNFNSISFQKGILILQNQFKESLNRQYQIDLKVKKFIQLLKGMYSKRSADCLTQEQHKIINDYSDYTELHSQNQQRAKYISILLNSLLKYINQIKVIKVFKPNDTFILIWDTFQVIFNYIFFYIFSIYLFFASYEEDIGYFKYIIYTFNILLIADILIILNKSFYLKDQVITERSLIFKNYIKSTLIFDLISLSSSLLALLKNKKSSVYNPHNEIQQYLLNLLILFRIIGIAYKKGIFDSLQSLSNSQRHLIKLVNQLLFMITFAHTCKFYLKNRMIKLHCLFKYKVGIFWYLIGLYQGIQGFNNYWLAKYNINNNPWYSQYFYSLYWAVTTMTTVGYGDITPANHLEALFNTVSMILFSCVFAYSINNIGMILQEIEKGTKELKDNVIIMQRQTFLIKLKILRYLRRRNVNAQLRSRIIHYLNFLAQETKDRNKITEDRIISILSNKLRDELTLDVNKKLIGNCTIIDKIFSQQTIKKMIFSMQEIQVSPNEIIFNQNDLGNQALYFILDGQIEIYSELEKSKSVYKILGSNQYFGEYSFFSGLSRKASARSLNLSTLYYLSRDSFLKIVKNNQEDMQRYKMLEEQICVNGDITALNYYGCFSCGQQDHYSINCKKTHLVSDSQLVTLKYNYFEFQQRQDYQRQNRKSKLMANALLLVSQNPIYSLRLIDYIQQFGGDLLERMYIQTNENVDSDEEREKQLRQSQFYSETSSDLPEDENQSELPKIKETLTTIDDLAIKNSKQDKFMKNQFSYNLQVSIKEDGQQDNLKKGEYTDSQNSLTMLEKKLASEEKSVIQEELKKSNRLNQSQKLNDLDSIGQQRIKQFTQQNSFEEKQRNLKKQFSLKKLDTKLKSIRFEQSENDYDFQADNSQFKDISSRQVSSETGIGMPNVFQDLKDNKQQKKHKIKGEDIKSNSHQRSQLSLVRLFTKLITTNLETKIAEELQEITDTLNKRNSNASTQQKFQKSSQNTSQLKIRSNNSFLQTLFQEHEMKGNKLLMQNIMEIFQKKGNSASIPNKTSILSRVLENFDQMFIFSKFFPHNNVSNVLNQLKLKKSLNGKHLPKSYKVQRNARRNNILLADFTQIQREIQTFELQNFSLQQTQDSMVFQQKYRPTVLSYGIYTKKCRLYPIRFSNKPNNQDQSQYF